ncbi:MAG: glycosyltransferase family 2 protein [Elusimicrobiota bacterium]
MNKLSSLSIVIPCHNESEVIKNTYAEIKTLLDKWQGKIMDGYEIVMVNNGSTDDTLEKMIELKNEDKNIVILDLRRNFGYQGSITAGLFNATKEMVVSIDADLQDDPASIADMIVKYYEGYDMVLGVRKKRKADFFLKRWTAHLYYWFLDKMGAPSVYNHGDFRLLSSSALEDLKKFPERNRYLRGMILNLESKYALVYYDRRKRKAGKTKFKIHALFGFALDGITSLSNTPIRIIALFGFVSFFVSVFGMSFILYVKLFRNVNVPGWAFIALTVMIFGGLQSLFIGIIGEYIAKSYLEVKQRPIFLIRKKYE